MSSPGHLLCAIHFLSAELSNTDDFPQSDGTIREHRYAHIWQLFHFDEQCKKSTDINFIIPTNQWGAGVSVY